jgi:hypothetical protein
MREGGTSMGVGGNQTSMAAEQSGAAYLFVRGGGTFKQLAYLKASNTQEGDEFGTRVAISDSAIVVGAPSEDSSIKGVHVGGHDSDEDANASGAVYLFR